jgi:NDP-sugar pyrophosphorylase family protein
MRAMILAAGLGTRLRPLTDDCPKALVEIDGRTLLEIAFKCLRAFGICDVIVNLYHRADMVVEYLKRHDHFGMRIEVSREDELLDTGGGLKNAAHFFLKNSTSPGEPFIVHNVDVMSTIDLGRMLRVHGENNALATLAMQDRKTSRYLLFDDRLQLCGRRMKSEDPYLVRPASQPNALAFSGIHVISPPLLAMMTEEGAFSIIDTYLRLTAQGEKILAFRALPFAPMSIIGAIWVDPRALNKPRRI